MSSASLRSNLAWPLCRLVVACLVTFLGTATTLVYAQPDTACNLYQEAAPALCRSPPGARRTGYVAPYKYAPFTHRHHRGAARSRAATPRRGHGTVGGPRGQSERAHEVAGL